MFTYNNWCHCNYKQCLFLSIKNATGGIIYLTWLNVALKDLKMIKDRAIKRQFGSILFAKSQIKTSYTNGVLMDVIKGNKGI